MVVSAIDNLGKGAASQAVQNMNIMAGWSEQLGLIIQHYIHRGDDVKEYQAELPLRRDLKRMECTAG